MDIAQHTASELARQHTEQYTGKSADCVSTDIASKIGSALFEAGYNSDDIRFADREFFALDALQDAGYPNILNS
jgi:hypothetical protein